MKKCNYCSGKWGDHANFCGYCGKPLDKINKPKQLPEIKETHITGFLSVDKIFDRFKQNCDFSIQIAKDGRIWIYIDGIAFIRFKPAL